MIADVACIVALPLAIDPAHAVRAGLGALAVIGSGPPAYLAFSRLERSGRRHGCTRSPRTAPSRSMRVSLAVLFAVAALAVALHVSIMLAGFALGLAVSAVGSPAGWPSSCSRSPRASSDRFFLWLGASLEIRALAGSPEMIGLGVCLGVGAVLAHLDGPAARRAGAAGHARGGPTGVPVAAATIGGYLGCSRPVRGRPWSWAPWSALVVAVAGGSLAARAGLVADWCALTCRGERRGQTTVTGPHG